MTAADAWFLRSFGEDLQPGPLELPAPQPGEAVVQVEACGMCHTDLGFASGSVAPKHDLPLVLGHEVVGTVVEAGDAYAELVGARVIVPAVLPCGQCALCAAERGNACNRQQMPGNDIHGGFSTHMLVRAAPLVRLDAPAGMDTRALSVVADAVSTAYQAALRADLAEGDAAIVIGSGGVGGYLVQIARAMGARVIACDVNDERLAAIADFGASATLNVGGRAPRDVRKDVQTTLRKWESPSLRWKIFECSGTTAGQELAYTLIGRASTLAVVGYTFDKTTVRLSNLMAYDATVVGSWGCPPEAYDPVLQMIYRGDVVLEPFIEYAPLSTINAQLRAMAAHTLTRRVVLDPSL